MTTCLGILDIFGGNPNIGYHVLNVVDNKIETRIQDMAYKTMRKNLRMRYS